MLAANALRHQMVLPEQQAIYDYWRSKCKNGQLPSRHDIEPGDIVDHLPMISLIEVHRQSPGFRFRCRLAGTGFWNLFEQEIQGQFIDELPLGDRREYWARVLSQVALKRRPTAGVTRPGTPLGSHLAQFWIRLPLACDENSGDILILGYDHLVKMSELEKPAAVPAQARA